MTALAQRLRARAATVPALEDRKGVAALEYALIAAAVVTIAMVAYRSVFANLSTFMTGIAFN